MSKEKKEVLTVNNDLGEFEKTNTVLYYHWEKTCLASTLAKPPPRRNYWQQTPVLPWIFIILNWSHPEATAVSPAMVWLLRRRGRDVDSCFSRPQNTTTGRSRQGLMLLTTGMSRKGRSEAFTHTHFRLQGPGRSGGQTVVLRWGASVTIWWRPELWSLWGYQSRFGLTPQAWWEYKLASKQMDHQGCVTNWTSCQFMAGPHQKTNSYFHCHSHLVPNCLMCELLNSVVESWKTWREPM